MTDVLRTGRLALHPVGMSDHRALLAHWTGPLVRRYLLDDRVITAVQVTEIIAASQHDFATAGYGLWALRPGPPADARPGARRAGARPYGRGARGRGGLPTAGPDPDGALVGVVGLRRQEGPAGRGPDVEIVYSLEPARWGQGLAAEAARAVLDYAFGVVGLPRVTAEIDARNSSSAEVVERLGMRPWRRGAGGGPDAGANGPDGPAYYAAYRTAWLGARPAIDA